MSSRRRSVVVPNVSECSVSNDPSKTVCTNPKYVDIIRKKLKISSDNDEDVIEDLKKNSGCETERCAIESVATKSPDLSSVAKKAIEEDFKLKGPANSTKLLNNSNIDKIIAQLAQKNPGLYAMDFHMINFDVFNNGNMPLNKISLATDIYESGKNMFSVVLNTDKYGNGGIHWFCMFCDFRPSGSSKDPFTIEYFNSSGRHPLASVSRWMIRQKCDFEKAHPDKNIVISQRHPFAHQTGETECGVYCIYYITTRVKNIHDRKFFETPPRIPDDEMESFRSEIFTNE